MSTFTESSKPAAEIACTVSRIDPMVVVSSADIASSCAELSFAAAANCSGDTSTPRSTTLNPAPSSIVATRFLPMSCRSPFTVPITTVPMWSTSAPDISERASFIARCAISSSGTKNSLARNFSPTTSIAAATPSTTMVRASMPASSACCVSAFAWSLLPMMIACLSSSMVAMVLSSLICTPGMPSGRLWAASFISKQMPSCL